MHILWLSLLVFYYYYCRHHHHQRKVKQTLDDDGLMDWCMMMIILSLFGFYVYVQCTVFILHMISIDVINNIFYNSISVVVPIFVGYYNIIMSVYFNVSGDKNDHYHHHSYYLNEVGAKDFTTHHWGCKIIIITIK